MMPDIDAIDRALEETVTQQLRICKEVGLDPLGLIVAALKNHGLMEEMARTAKDYL